MTYHIFKIIWTERKANFWILLELILVFSILYFCVDYLSFMGKRYFEPKGFDIKHTYVIKLGTRKNIKESGNDNRSENLRTIHDRIKKYPAIESASLSLFAYPYGIVTGNEYMVDSVKQKVLDKIVDLEFFKLFDIKLTSGRFFEPTDIVASDVNIISPDADNMFANKNVQEVKKIALGEAKYKVVGATRGIKKSEFEEYSLNVFSPLKKDEELLSSFGDLCVRVKADADKDFSVQFTKDMQSQMEVGSFYLASVVPIEKIREDYISNKGYDNNLKSIYAIVIFLLANIFLIVIGTFWFRIQSRRNEIGVRIAFGASKRSVKSMFIQESILLLFVASLFAMVICINMSMGNVLKDLGIPVPDRDNEISGLSQYFLNYSIGFIFLALIIILAVWYPARKASNIQPAEALRDE